MAAAIYPGSFDPVTNGHLDILTRGSQLFDRIIVAVLQNSQKQSLFSVAEQLATLNRRLSPQLETIFLLASEGNRAVSSRMVKEIASLGGDVSSFVPPHVALMLRLKYGHTLN